MLHRLHCARHCQITAAALLTACSNLFSSPVQADTLAMADAQVSEPNQFDVPTMDLSARALSNAGKLGLRLTMPRIADHLVFFLDGSRVEGDRSDLAINGDVDYSGAGGGLGLFYTGMPDLGIMSTTLRISAHREKSDVDTLLSISGRQGSIKSDLYSQAIHVLFSPRKPLHASGLNGYLSAGIGHDRESRVLRLDGIPNDPLSRRDSRLNGIVEAGIVYPMDRFRFYSVVTYHEDWSLSLGLRYRLRGAARTP